MSIEVPEGEGVPRLREIVKILRAPGGCPWDIEQTHESLIPNLLEEAYEAAAAIRSGDRDHMEEELGDLLLQAVMHGEIGEGEGSFDLDSMADGVSEKLIRRHPHVFADSDATDTEAVLKQWEDIKKEEKGGEVEKSLLDGVGEGLTALQRSSKLQKKVAKVGFDWEDTAGILAKLQEEIGEVQEAIESGKPEEIDDELGDVLFVAVNLTRFLGRDAESLLDAGNHKFARRFAGVEQHLASLGKTVEDAELAEMEEGWEATKRAE